MKFAINTVLSALIIAGVAEVGKRSSFLGAVLISIPLSSVLAMIFLYLETGDSEKVAALSLNILWLLIPSLGFMLLLPALLRSGWSFWTAMGTSCLSLAIGYIAYAWALRKFGINL